MADLREVKYDERIFSITPYNDAALRARIAANETAITDRYTKQETDAKIAEAVTDVDQEHFHVVTALPPAADAKENNEYVVVTYEADGTTIKTEEHYLFYDGAYHKRNTQVSLEGYATEQYVRRYVEEQAPTTPMDRNGFTLNTRGEAIRTSRIGVEQKTAGELEIFAQDNEYTDFFRKTVYQKEKIDTLLDAKQDDITGGTTGSVLTKASDTDGDFEWRQLGKDNMIYDVLWERDDITVWENPVLSRSFREYDILVFEMWESGDFRCESFVFVPDIQLGETFTLNGVNWVRNTFTDETHIMSHSGTGATTVVCRRVTGIVFSRLDGTVGRWEKIGEWTGSQTGLQLDLAPYQTIALTCIGNNVVNQHNVNTVMINVEDIQTTGETSLRSYPNPDSNATLTKTASGYNLVLAGSVWGARLYGYKEAAISEADVQRIAALVPGGGNVDQTYDATSTNAQSGTAVAEALEDKQDWLVSGESIKTVNGNSLLGAGNLVIRQGVGDSYDSNDMPTANEVKQRIDNHDLLYIDGNWLITSYYNESSIFYIRSEYANTVREYAFEFNNIWDAPLPAPMTIDEFDSIFARATANYGPAPASGYFNYGGDGFIWIEGLDDGIRINAKSPGTSSPTKTKEYKIRDTNYEMASDSGTGNVVQVGTIDIYGTQYGVYEFFYNTSTLPNATTAVYSFATLLADYTIYSFIEAVGVTDTGIHIGNGRTDGTTQIAVQQFSKNSKTMTIRTYQDYSKNRAVMRIQFIGTKNA